MNNNDPNVNVAAVEHSQPNDVGDIIKAYLELHGFEGLWNPDGDCACAISNLAPCGEPLIGCCPGYETPCPDSCGEHDFHISKERT